MSAASFGWLTPVLSGARVHAVDPIPLSAGARAEAAALAESTPVSLREPVTRGALQASLRRQLEVLATSSAAAYGRLYVELVQRIGSAWCLAGDVPATLRVEVVHEQTCPRFHVDRLRLRLCCTAHGAGTEWLPASAQANHPDSYPLAQRAPTGALFAMRGSVAGPGLYHRSPPASRAAPRLFVALDFG